MLPLSLLKCATGSPLLVELKSGETYNGRLVSCDAWMNMNLREVICTSKDGDKFFKLPTCYIRGSAVKYLRLPPDLVDKAVELDEQQQQQFEAEVVEEAEVVAVGADVVEDAVVDEEEEAGVEAVVEVEMAVGEMVVGEVEMEVEEMAVGEVEEAREAEVAEVEGAEEEIPATKVRPNQ
eukprot:CAMPEP_0119005730 /NCGR_PEP_ID=MMETSP1176-20130426/1897_1 /TAXON_ID=265551 /ORGANISM="Synedropsis recta cf, Strain CCMP1620" /LENGTH=178 /DNA_ID=CAMNT_0006957571 /DNA_START=122 /DNA_END=659 /DNA_ORIENTATION=+